MAKVIYKAQIVKRGGGLLGIIEHEDKATAELLVKRFIGPRTDTETYWTTVHDYKAE